MNKRILIIIGILALIGLIVGFIYWFQFIRPSLTQKLCADFHEIKGEITCQEAVGAALKEYRGTIYDIKSAIVQIRQEKAPTFQVKNVWILKIKLSEIIELQRVGEYTDNIKLFIDKKDGSILKLQAI